jgi:hypothetical protein
MNDDSDMAVGTLRVRLVIRGARSLKDRRRAVRSVKDRLRHRFNCSVAEVDDLDVYQSVGLGVAVVGNDRDYLQSVLSKITRFVSLDRNVELADSQMEIL